MTKIDVQDFLRMYEGIFLDALTLDKSLRKGFDADLRQLESLLSKNGSQVVTIWFPAMDKRLCQALDLGKLYHLGMPGFRPAGETPLPRLFYGMWRQIFDNNGGLKQDVDPTWVLLLRQALMLGAKVRTEAKPSRLFETVNAFFKVESQLPKASPIWASEGSLSDGDCCGHFLDLSPRHGDLGLARDISYAGTDSSLLDSVQRVADIVAGRFGEFFPSKYRFRHGRGATAEFRRGGGYKYSFPTWNPRLETVFPYSEFGTSNPALLGAISADQVEPVSSEIPSRLIPVPKTQKGPRLIAAEPTCNQWAQQCMLDFFIERIKADSHHKDPILSRSIDFERQDISGQMALDASLDGVNATLDLSDASDRLSCWTIQRIFRRNISVLNAVIACRTRYLRNDVDKKHPTVIELRKFATMGSALTFPLQSITFVCMALAAGWIAERYMTYHTYDAAPTETQLSELAGRVRVYGDDIIVPVHWLEGLARIFKLVGLKVNESKTFSGSNFRESCGVDGYKGYDVTPVKVKAFYRASEPASAISVLDTCNLLFMKGLWHTAEALRSTVQLGSIPVVYADSGVWGDVSFCGWRLDHLRKRWNERLQHYEYQMIQPKAKIKKSHRSETAANLLQFFTEDPTDSDLSIWESGLTATSEAGISRRWVDPASWAGYSGSLVG